MRRNTTNRLGPRGQRPSDADLSQVKNLLSVADSQEFDSDDEEMAKRIVTGNFSDESGEDSEHDNFLDSLIDKKVEKIRHTQQVNDAQRPSALQNLAEEPRLNTETLPQHRFRGVSLVSESNDGQSSDEEVKRVGPPGIGLNQMLQLERLKTQFENGELQAELSEDQDSDSSSESDSDVDQKLQDLASQAKKQTMRLGTYLRVYIYDMAGPMGLVELNEQQNAQAEQQQIQAENLLSSFDKEFYQVDRDVLKIQELPQLSQQLMDEKHQYYGAPTCLRLFRTKKGLMVFVGNSAGYIQVFDAVSQKRRRPLFDVAVRGKEVRSFDISSDGHFLVAGHSKGTIALWDCSKFRLAHLVCDAGKDEKTVFSNVKIAFCDAGNLVRVIASSQTGIIRIVDITKNMLGKYSHSIDTFQRNMLTIDIQQTSSQERFFSEFCAETCLAAIGNSDLVGITDLKDETHEALKVFKRPSICSHALIIPTLSWGYGISPNDQTKSVPLLAMGWEKSIELVMVNSEDRDFEMAGYYISETEIHSVKFIADSILAIVTDGKIRVLHTGRFMAGMIYQLSQNKQPHEFIKEIKQKVEQCKVCEIGEDQSLPKLRYGRIEGKNERTKIIRSLPTYDPTVTFLKHYMGYLCNDRVIIAKIGSWKDYIDRLIKQGEDWLTVIKAAMDIYSGEQTGFVSLPASKKDREAYMQDFMKELLMKNIQTVVNKNRQSVAETESQQEQGYTIEDVAIKVSIEFCLAISDIEFLFGAVYQFFLEKGLEARFISNLSSPIMVGSFEKETVPGEILLKMIKSMEEAEQYAKIDKVLQNLNIEAYSGVENESGQTILKTLIQVAIKHCLINAAIVLLQTSQKTKKTREGCNVVLKMLLNSMELQKAKLELAESKGKKVKRITRLDMRSLRGANKKQKQEIEQSAYYLGYRLLWIMGLFLRGKSFSRGELSEAQYRLQVYQIVDFVTDDDNLASLLDFDAEAFFMVVMQLFTYRPWYFLTKSGNYRFKFRKLREAAEAAAANEPSANNERKEEDEEEKETICNVPIANDILSIFQEAAERRNRKEPEFTKAAFRKMLLQIVAEQRNELLANKRRNPASYQQITLDYSLAFKAISSLFKVHHHGEKSIVAEEIEADVLNEQSIINALKAVKLEDVHVDRLIKLAQTASKGTNQLTLLKIQLYESKQDYQAAFMQHLNDVEVREKVFGWVAETLNKLKLEEIQWKKENGFLEEQSQQNEEVKEVPSDQERDESDRDSDSDDEAQRRKSSADKKASQSQAQEEDPNPYPPLARLKQAVKDRMLKLAQLNCEQTITLIENFFNSGDFQEKLIMQKFSQYPQEQMNYLLRYITKNEKEIELTMRDRTYNPAFVVKLEKYLVQFTKLLCKLDPDQVEDWVSRQYFPVEQCLQVCRTHENQQGQAVLLKRFGKPFQAINMYTEILMNYPILNLCEQIKLLYKDEPTFLSGMLDPEDEDEATAHFMAKKNTVNTFALTHITNFDMIIGRACQICMLDELDIDQRQQGWLQLIRFLKKYRGQVDAKCNEAIEESIQDLGRKSSAKFSPITESNKDEVVEKLKNFIDVRIMYILQFPGLSIPLKQLLEQLNLNGQQIKDLMAAKMSGSEINFNIEKTQSNVVRGQHLDEILCSAARLGQGYLVEPQKRTGLRSRRKMAFTSSICSLCRNSIAEKNRIVIYGCSHEFHAQCLIDCQEFSESEKCPVCLKMSYQAIREEVEKMQLEAEKAAHRDSNHNGHEQVGDRDENDEDDEEEKEREEFAITTKKHFLDFEEDGMKELQQQMLYKKLDQFDTILDDINLELSEFLEEMAE